MMGSTKVRFLGCVIPPLDAGLESNPGIEPCSTVLLCRIQGPRQKMETMITKCGRLLSPVRMCVLGQTKRFLRGCENFLPALA